MKFMRDKKGRFLKGYPTPNQFKKGHKVSEETKKKISNNAKINPNYGMKGKSRNVGIKRNCDWLKGNQQGFKKGQAAWNKGKPLSKEHRKMVIKNLITFPKGNKHPDWKGGISFEPYGLEFNNKLKEQIRKRDNFRCQQCFRHQDELFRKFKNGKLQKYKLHIHHIDYNKRNNNSDNLVSLCGSCHTQTNHTREDWTKYYKGVIKNS